MKNSRRNFINKSILGATAMSSLSSFNILSNEYYQRKDKLGIALVGLGSLSTNQIAPALLKTQKCYLAGIVTGTPKKEGIWADKYGIKKKNIYNYQNFDEIAKNKEIDIIYIVLPNGMHAEYTIRAANAGKHVLCEKPMSNTVQEAEEMIAACSSNGVKLAVGYRLHFEPHNKEIMRIGQESVFGKVKLVENSFGFRIGDPTQWRLNKELAGGGALMDVGIYALQAALYALGEIPVSVTAQEVKTDPIKFKEVDETVYFQMKFPSGAIANCGTSYNANIQHLNGYCENGWFQLSPAYVYSGIKGSTNKGQINFEQVDHFEKEMDDFSSCIMNDKQSIVPGDMGLRDMKIIDAIYKSIDNDGLEIDL